MNFPFILNLSHDVAGTIFYGRQDFRKASVAGPVATAWDRHAYRFVGALQVIDGAPLVKAPLAMVEVAKHIPVQNFRIQRTVESFVLALGLRMIGPGVAHSNAQANEPRGERGIGMVGIRSPRRSVVHRHAPVSY